MLIQGADNAVKVAKRVSESFFGSSDKPFSLIIGEFGHDCRDNWYFIRFFSPRINLCRQNVLEQQFCTEFGFHFK